MAPIKITVVMSYELRKRAWPSSLPTARVIEGERLLLPSNYLCPLLAETLLETAVKLDIFH